MPVTDEELRKMRELDSELMRDARNAVKRAIAYLREHPYMWFTEEELERITKPRSKWYFLGALIDTSTSLLIPPPVRECTVGGRPHFRYSPPAERAKLLVRRYLPLIILILSLLVYSMVR